MMMYTVSQHHKIFTSTIYALWTSFEVESLRISYSLNNITIMVLTNYGFYKFKVSTPAKPGDADGRSFSEELLHHNPDASCWKATTTDDKSSDDNKHENKQDNKPSGAQKNIHSGNDRKGQNPEDNKKKSSDADENKNADTSTVSAEEEAGGQKKAVENTATQNNTAEISVVNDSVRSKGDCCAVAETTVGGTAVVGTTGVVGTAVVENPEAARSLKNTVAENTVVENSKAALVENPKADVVDCSGDVDYSPTTLNSLLTPMAREQAALFGKLPAHPKPQRRVSASQRRVSASSLKSNRSVQSNTSLSQMCRGSIGSLRNSRGSMRNSRGSIGSIGSVRSLRGSIGSFEESEQDEGRSGSDKNSIPRISLPHSARMSRRASGIPEQIVSPRKVASDLPSSNKVENTAADNVLKNIVADNAVAYDDGHAPNNIIGSTKSSSEIYGCRLSTGEERAGDGEKSNTGTKMPGSKMPESKIRDYADNNHADSNHADSNHPDYHPSDVECPDHIPDHIPNPNSHLEATRKRRPEDGSLHFYQRLRKSVQKESDGEVKKVEKESEGKVKR
jgi:hypothetical protein